MISYHWWMVRRITIIDSFFYWNKKQRKPKATLWKREKADTVTVANEVRPLHYTLFVASRNPNDLNSLVICRKLVSENWDSSRSLDNLSAITDKILRRNWRFMGQFLSKPWRFWIRINESMPQKLFCLIIRQFFGPCNSFWFVITWSITPAFTINTIKLHLKKKSNHWHNATGRKATNKWCFRSLYRVGTLWLVNTRWKWIKSEKDWI